jgi:hypothetical protein
MPLPKITLSISDEDAAFLAAHPKEDYPQYRPAYIFRQAMKKIRAEAAP